MTTKQSIRKELEKEFARKGIILGKRTLSPDFWKLFMDYRNRPENKTKPLEECMLDFVKNEL